MAKVSIVRCRDYDFKQLKDAVFSSVDALGGLGSFIKSGDKVLLKPNMLMAKSSVSCITTNHFFVRACAELVRDFGAVPFVGDSPPVHTATKVAQKTGIYDELQKIGVKIVELNTPAKLRVRDDAVFKDIYVAKEALDADSIINLPKVKTHTQMTLTACVKNMFGVIIGKEKALWHLKAGISKDYFARMLLDLYYAFPPALTIADMITIMEGNGPSAGAPKDVGLVVAGSDCVAMDSVISAILKIPIKLVNTVTQARELGDKSGHLENIDVIGGDIEALAKEVNGVRLPHRTELDFGLPDFLRKLLRDMLTSRPVIDRKICKFCRSCEKICPVSALSVSREKITFDYEKCIRCYCCQEMCSYKALTVQQGILLKLLP